MKQPIQCKHTSDVMIAEWIIQGGCGWTVLAIIWGFMMLLTILNKCVL